MQFVCVPEKVLYRQADDVSFTQLIRQIMMVSLKMSDSNTECTQSVVGIMSHHLHGPFNGNLSSLPQSRGHTELFHQPAQHTTSICSCSCCGLFPSVRRAAHMETNEKNRFTLSHLITETHLHPHQQWWEVRKSGCLLRPPQLDSRLHLHEPVSEAGLDTGVWTSRCGAEDMSTHSMDCSEAAALRPAPGTKLVVWL